MRRITFMIFIDEGKPRRDWFSKLQYCNENKSFEEEGPFSYVTDVMDKLNIPSLSTSNLNLLLDKILEINYDFELVILVNNLESWYIEKVGKAISFEYTTLSLCGGIWTKMFKKIPIQSNKDAELNFVMALIKLLNKTRAKFIFHNKVSEEYLFGFFDKDKNLVVYLIAKESPGKLPLGILSELARISEEKRLKNGIFQFTDRLIKIS